MTSQKIVTMGLMLAWGRAYPVLMSTHTAPILSTLATVERAVTDLASVDIMVTYATAHECGTTILVVSRTDLSRAISTLNTEPDVPMVDVTSTSMAADVPTTYGKVRILSSL